MEVIQVTPTAPAAANNAPAPQQQVPEVPPQVAPPKVDEGENARFASMAKKEKAILLAKREMAQREKQLNERNERLKAYEELDDLKRKNPLEALKRIGLSYDDLTNAYLNEGKLSPEQVAAIKAEEIATSKFEEFQKRQTEQQATQQQEQYNRALAQIRSDVESLVNSGDEAYALVKDMGAYDTVTQLIEQTFQETGRVMTVEEASKQAETHFLDWVEKAAKIDKVKSRLLKLLDAEPKDQKPPAGTPASQQQQTLTHKTTSSPPATKPVTYAERRARAIAIAEGRIPPT